MPPSAADPPHAAARADLLDLLPDGVVVADADERVTEVSAVAARMLGRPAEELRGRTLREVLSLRDQDDRAWYDEVCPYGGLATRTGVPERSVLLPDGDEVLVTARLHRPSLTSPVTQVAVVLRSGRGRARLDRDRSDLVATVAHELRSPLTGVKGFVQAMLNRWDKLSDEQKKLMLTTVSVDSDRLSRLIAELLDVARIDTGRLQLYPRPCDAAVLVRRVVDSVAAGAAHPVVLTLDDELPDAHADPDKLTQVVTNLVENGVRHGDGEVRVSVRAEVAGTDAGTDAGTTAGTDAGGGARRLRIAVEDQGAGIPAELRRRVFTKFWKGGARGGSGLGLYIVHGLTRAHGGSVAIEDADGGGARLVVLWPCEPPDDDAV